MPETITYSPGMRLRIRDEEFSLLHADSLMTGGSKLTCLGVSETVAGKEFEFISELEDPEILRPEDTKLVPDVSPRYRDSMLYLETQLRSRVSTGGDITLGHQAAMDTMDFQLEPARMALAQTRPRILIADTVGLGKTLEAGILVTELMARGRGKRILVVTVKSMLTQFQKEFWNRFTIPLVRMDSQGLARVRTRIPRNHNPFDYIEKSIISVDTLKNEDEYRVYLEKAFWDIIIIDEAHHVSFKGTRTLSHRLAGLLGSRSDALILLSATPHNGKPESFASLMKMLDPTSIADVKKYEPEDIKGLFIRRFRKDVAHQMRGGLPERKVMTWDAHARDAEEEAYKALNALRFAALDKGKTANQLSGGHMLKSVSLKKALLSSPAACRAQIDTMIKNLDGNGSPEAVADQAQLRELALKVDAIGKNDFSKYQHLVSMFKNEWEWTGKASDDRLVIFTERLETLKFLGEHLPVDLRLPEGAVRTMTGSMSDVDIQDIVEEFGKDRSAIRILIATDVASEGLNLHFQSHRLVHFDIPWSLMVFQQRNGRIDRYGQTREPQIAYLLTRYKADVMGGDIRVLELLIEKEKAAWKNIGDPATLMGQFDPEKEELYTADLLLDQDRLHAFQTAPVEDTSENDFLADLYSAWDAASDPAASDLPTAHSSTGSGSFLLYCDFDYLKEGLLSLHGGDAKALDLAESKTQQALSFDLDDDLESWLKEQLPRELRPEASRLELIGDPKVMMNHIRKSQAEERAWPEADYLWANHPIFSWLTDRLVAARGRLQAPVIFLPLQDDAVFLLSSTHPNRRGRPVYQRLWAAIHTGSSWRVEDGELWLGSQNLKDDKPVNDGKERDLSELQRLIPEAVSQVHSFGKEDFQTFRVAQQKDMDRRLREMDTLRQHRTEQLELALGEGKQPERIRLARMKDEKDRINATFREWSDWVRDSMTLEDRAHIQVLAVFCKKT
jgi:ERCC4-related helicase